MLAPTRSSTKLLTLSALVAATLFCVGHADAGTQRPVWRFPAPSNTNPAPPAPNQNQDQINVIDQAQPNPPVDEGQDPPIGQNSGGTGGDAQGPVAVPTPSAVAGGLALLGLMTRRRRRLHDASED
ncbi:MAG: hypothetical protein AAGG38_04680 [Planctomycetota bacterium]